MLVIADDLTGALDSAVAFAQQGLSSWAALSLDILCSGPVVAINTDSRDDEEFLARRKVSAVVGTYLDRRIFKKIDSTLRGNFAAELAETLRMSGCERVIIAPAFPAAGRTTENGVQLVFGRPVHEEYRLNADGLPRPTSHIPTILESWTGLGVSSHGILDPGMSLHSLAQSIEDDPHPLVVFDAITQDDLERIARASLLLSERTVFCGAGGLAKALAAWWREGAVAQQESPQRGVTNGPLLVVAGSFNTITARQLAHLAADLPQVPVIEIEIDDLLKGRVRRFVSETLSSLAQNQATVIAIRNEGFRIGVGRRPAQTLGALVRAVCERSLPGGLLLTGGDIAQAICEALGAARLYVAREYLPGMPLSYLEGGIADGLAVITKAGGFGEASVLSESIKRWLPPTKGIVQR